MLPSQDRPHDTRSRTIPANIRRQFGYPSEYRNGPTDDILARLDALESMFAAIHEDPDYLALAMRLAGVERT